MAGNFLGNCVCTLFGAGFFVAGCTILLVTAFPVVQIVIGAVYMNECPLAPEVPVFVLVSGIGALVIMTLLALPALHCPAQKSSSVWTLWMLSLGLLYFGWFIYGSYHIYSVYPPNYTQSSTVSRNITYFGEEQQNRGLPQNSSLHRMLTLQSHQHTQTDLHCHHTLYLFAFWTTTLVYICAANALVILLCLCGCMLITDKVVNYLTA